MFFPNIDLARRIEASEALGAEACAVAAQRANPAEGAAAIRIAGGCACYTGADSPLTQVLGIGLVGPVTDEEMDRMEEFYRERACPVAIDLCPLADITLLDIMRKRGYRLVEFTNMLVHQIGE
ncbi:MAG: hypothetical protein ABIZ80_11470, partial [Bryobacteraceae bacterium]